MSETAVPSAPRSGARLSGMLSDDRLAQRATKGDRRAFAAIFRRYHQDLYRYCAAIVGNPEDAQDALQNTMVKVLRALPGEKRQIRLKPWLYRIAHNESIELLRRRRATDPLDPELAISAAGPVEAAELRERLRRLISDLEELPERQRGALVMRELAGLDFAEIGAAFGTSAAVARQTVYEARLSLRQIEAGREMSCATVTKALSDGDGRTLRRREIRAHLRSCESCRAFREETGRRRSDLAALAPLPAVAASALLHGMLGAQGGSSGGGLAGALSGGAGKVLGTSALAKSAATVAVVAAVGISAGDRAGLIHVGLPGGESPTHHSRSATVPGGSTGAANGAMRRSNAAGAERRSSVAGASPARAVAKAHQRSPVARSAEKGSHRQAEHGSGAASTSEGASHGASGAAHGRGHANALPAAAAHGQETAATNHGNGKGTSHASTHAHPAAPPSHSHPKSTHPSPPATPGNGHHASGTPPPAPASKGSQVESPTAQPHGNGR